jgi:hypothetical protein
MIFLYVAMLSLIFEINGFKVSTFITLALIPFFIVSSIVNPHKYNFRELLPVCGVFFVWCAYMIFNNLINENVLYLGVLWWLVIPLFIVLNPKRNIFYEVKAFFYLVLIGLLVDLTYRLSFVSLSDISTNYYLSKKNSLLGVDSNISGIYGLLCLSILLSVRKLNILGRKFLSLSIAMILILIMLTFSKAAIFSSLVLLAYSYLPLRLFSGVLILFILIGLQFSLGNESGLSKFELYELSLTLLDGVSSEQFLIGIGLGNVIFDVNGLTPHILFLQLILYLGLIGLCIYALLWLSLLKIVGRPLMYLLIPYFLVSLSFTPIGFPPLSFVILFFIRYRKELV